MRGGRMSSQMMGSSKLWLLLLACAVLQARSEAPAGAIQLSSGGWDCSSPPSAAAVRLAPPLQADSRTVLGKPDVHSCMLLQPPPAAAFQLPAASSQHPQGGGSEAAAADGGSGGAITHLQLSVLQPPTPGQGAQLYRALLLECPADFWQLAGVQEEEHVCVANTAALLAGCTQWMLPLPQAPSGSATACAPAGTAFALPAALQGRVLLLQAHWRLPGALNNTAVTLPTLQLQLGATPVGPAATAAAGAAAAAAQPTLLGTFVASGVYPPSSLTKTLQAFELPVPGSSSSPGAGSSSSSSPGAGSSSSSSSGSPVVTAEFACGRRCTFVPMGRVRGRPVSVVGFQFTTFDRALSVAFDVKRGVAGQAAGAASAVHAAAEGGRGLVALQEPFKLYPGDVLRWRCAYNASGLPPSGVLRGGHAAHPAALQEQCTLSLAYHPRVAGMHGCSAALAGGPLRGENMCSNEARDLLALAASEGGEFPLRRMYRERSFPVAEWMGGWKATHLVMQLGMVLAVLWATHTTLATCTALGPVHRRFLALAPGQQRNVAVYVTHLLLDTAVLLFVARPMMELWCGFVETTAEVRVGEWGFTYIVACYVLELTWRRRVDTMLAVHHVGTIIIILVNAGELTAYTYPVANSVIVLAAFAVMEQPTYIALLCKRMLPPCNRHVMRAAWVGYTSWFLLKGVSVLLAASMFYEDWDVMPPWVRVNFAITWVIATLVQGWSGVIQYGIYRHIRRSYHKAQATAWEQQQAALKRSAAAALLPAGRRQAQASSSGGSSEEERDDDADAEASSVTSTDAGGSSLANSSPSGSLRQPLLQLSPHDSSGGGSAPSTAGGSGRIATACIDEAPSDDGPFAVGGGGGAAAAVGPISTRLPSRHCSSESGSSSPSGGGGALPPAALQASTRMRPGSSGSGSSRGTAAAGQQQAPGQRDARQQQQQQPQEQLSVGPAAAPAAQVPGVLDAAAVGGAEVGQQH